MKTLKKPKNKIIRILFLIFGIVFLTLAIGILILASVAPYLSRRNQTTGFADDTSRQIQPDKNMFWQYPRYSPVSGNEDFITLDDYPFSDDALRYNFPGALAPFYGLWCGSSSESDEPQIYNPNSSYPITFSDFALNLSSSWHDLTMDYMINTMELEPWSITLSGGAFPSEANGTMSDWNDRVYEVIILGVRPATLYYGTTINTYTYFGLININPDYSSATTLVLCDIYLDIISGSTRPTELSGRAVVRNPMTLYTSQFGTYYSRNGLLWLREFLERSHNYEYYVTPLSSVINDVVPSDYEEPAPVYNLIEQTTIGNPVTFFLGTVSDFLNTSFFGNFSLASIVLCVLFVVVAIVFLKIFAGG